MHSEVALLTPDGTASRNGAVVPRTDGSASSSLTLSVNSESRRIDIEPRVSLLDALREHLDLTGSKKGCDQCTCGACTVWGDGRRVMACLTLARACEGREVTTIEGLTRDGELHPMQQAFIEHDAFLSGYCTPGQIMSAIKLIEEGNATSNADIAKFMSGNICRCAAYPNIRVAIRQVRDATTEATMRPLIYARATNAEQAIAPVAADPTSAFLAGGTTEVDLLRAGVAHPDRLIDINKLPLPAVEELPNGGVRISASAPMSDAARTPLVTRRYLAVSQALLSGASEQLRNMASMGGNLCQRVRCLYLREIVAPCDKREPGSGCSALEGLDRGRAILSATEHCNATDPSALVAFDAIVYATSPSGPGKIAVDDFYLLPGTTPHLEHPLQRGELITAIEPPPLPVARRDRSLVGALASRRPKPSRDNSLFVVSRPEQAVRAGAEGPSCD